MPEYVLHRTHTLRTTNGVISFQKGIPTWVTPQMEKDAVNIGAQRCEGEAPDPLGEEKKPVQVLTSDEREAQFFAAFELLIETNDAKDFTGQGVPRVKSVERLTSLNVEQGEVIDLWHKYKMAKVDES